jgi:hypothetical protein
VEEATALRDRVREMVKDESDEIKIWARVHLGRERRLAVAKEFGYRDGSGATHLLKKLEQNAGSNRELRRKLTRLKQAIASTES